MDMVPPETTKEHITEQGSSTFRERVKSKIAEMNSTKTGKAVITGAKAVFNLSSPIGFYALKFGVSPHNVFLNNPDMHINPGIIKFGIAATASIALYAFMNREQIKIIFGKDAKA